MSNTNSLYTALAYYYELRSQDKSPDEAVTHVRLRYGVVIEPTLLLAADSVAHYEDDKPAFGSDFYKPTVVGCVATPSTAVSP